MLQTLSSQTLYSHQEKDSLTNYIRKTLLHCPMITLQTSPLDIVISSVSYVPQAFNTVAIVMVLQFYNSILLPFLLSVCIVITQCSSIDRLEMSSQRITGRPRTILPSPIFCLRVTLVTCHLLCQLKKNQEVRARPLIGRFSVVTQTPKRNTQ